MNDATDAVGGLFMRIPTLAAAGLMVVATSAFPANRRPTPVVTAPLGLFSYESEPGDIIGQGQSAVITHADADFYILSTNDHVEIRVNFPNQLGWNIRLAPPVGTRWTPGRYVGAELLPGRTAGSPGLDVFSPNGACGSVWGEVGLRQVVYGSDGRVRAIEASFVQHCNSPDAPALAGAIRYNIPPLSFHLDGEAGALTEAAISKTYYNDTSTLSVAGSLSLMEIDVSGQQDRWTAYIAAPTGKTLKAGTYDTKNSADQTHVGMDFFGDGSTCNANDGTLVIHSVSTDPRGRILRLFAEFQQACVGGSVTGVLHYGA